MPPSGDYNFDDPWTPIFRAMIDKTLRSYESTDDVMAGAQFLAQRRAALFERPLQITEDLPYALSMWCWYPFKVRAAANLEDRLRSARTTIFSELASASEADIAERLRVVPNRALWLTLPRLFERLASGQFETDLFNDPDSNTQQSAVPSAAY